MKTKLIILMSFLLCLKGFSEEIPFYGIEDVNEFTSLPKQQEFFRDDKLELKALFYEAMLFNEKKGSLIFSITTEENVSSQIRINSKVITDDVSQNINNGSVCFYSIYRNRFKKFQEKMEANGKFRIPLGLETKTIGNFKISIDDFKGYFRKYRIILIDKELGVRHNLKRESYSFFLDNRMHFKDRFVLLIKERKSKSQKEISIFAKNGEVKIISEKRIDKVAVISVAGNYLGGAKENGLQYKIPFKTNVSQEKLVVAIRFETGEIIKRQVVNKN